MEVLKYVESGVDDEAFKFNSMEREGEMRIKNFRYVSLVVFIQLYFLFI